MCASVFGEEDENGGEKDKRGDCLMVSNLGKTIVWIVLPRN